MPVNTEFQAEMSFRSSETEHVFADELFVAE
jgi:hypothetical protein